MRRNAALLFVIGLLLACAAPETAKDETRQAVLQIRWQRLVNDQGQTCDRCGATEKAIDDATRRLRRSLGELNIEVALEKNDISQTAFSKDPLQSNRIWIAGKPIEEWLSASSGQSRCCSACGDSACRTVMLDGRTYEAIPAELIVKAGLLAGAQLVQGEGGTTCCPSAESTPGVQTRCGASPPCQQ